MARIVAVGGAIVDVRARAGVEWIPDRSLPGVVRLVAGGAARNVAVDLVRFGHHVTLLTAVGRDPLGTWLLETTAADGVDISGALVTDGQTGVYVTAGPEGGAPWCVSDGRILEAVTPDDIARWRPLIETADVIVADANLTAGALDALTIHAGGRSRVLLTTSRAKAPRLIRGLRGAAALVGSREEGAALTGHHRDADWRAIGRAMLTMGVAQAALTDGAHGVAVMTPAGDVWMPAPAVRVVDPTGAGDAVAASVVHAWVRGLGRFETAALAVAAASVVVQSEKNTPDELSAMAR